MHVLVSAATKHGSTAEIASALGERLREAGLEVTVADPDDVAGLDGIDAAVLGSAVYAGHWLKPAKALIDRLGGEFAKRPVWLFSSGPLGDPPKPDEDPVDVAALIGSTGARDHRIFAGMLERSRLGFAERAIVRALHAPEGDFRDWEAIEGWAAEIAAELTG